MDNGQTTLTDPASGKVREFAFDKSYWSHDGFSTDPSTGYMAPNPGSKYADQDLVMRDFGMPVIDNAFEGYNVCMFAYGQTGSGKSYSIVGYPGNAGIIPRACEEIFRRVGEREKDAENTVKFEV
jgi:kinesin family protein 1